MEPLPSSVLPAGVRVRILPGINGLDIHVLEAGLRDKRAGRRCCCCTAFPSSPIAGAR